jgi:hypothetical protein
MSRALSFLAFAALSGITGLAASPLKAQEAHLGMEVDTAVVSVGDRITLTVTVDHPNGSRVLWPDSLDLAPFEVLEAQAEPPTSQGEGVRSSLSLTLTAFDLGDLEIPSFDVEITGSDGESATLATEPVGIQVLTVGLDEGGDIRDIKGPLGIPLDLLPILLILLAVALVGVVGRGLYRRFRRGDPELKDTGPAAPWRAPHEIALEALDRLENSGLLARGEVKEYHIRISEILRRYVEGRFKVPALEMTTLDILPGLEERGLDTTVLEGFETVLDQCDMVKFAKYQPESSATGALLSLGRRLVEETVPIHGTRVPEPTTGEEPELQEANP